MIFSSELVMNIPLKRKELVDSPKTQSQFRKKVVSELSKNQLFVAELMYFEITKK